LSEAEDFQEILLVQSKFMQAQMDAFGEQTGLGWEFSKAIGAVKPPFNT
jgi:hypothetical protein